LSGPKVKATDSHKKVTRVDQLKEGQDTAKPKANIGLHYIATASSTTNLPMDTDNDGIPDYVENWHGDANILSMSVLRPTSRSPA
jgi:hypothetical protein